MTRPSPSWPPTVHVSCVYPGANAKVLADTVAAPIEQQVNGVEDMLYMSSQCTNDGAYSLTITFKLGTDLDMAQVRVQNRVAMAVPNLPEAVRQTGVTTNKQSPNLLLVVNLVSPDGRYGQLYLSNFATIQVKDVLARLEGVGSVGLLGQQDYSMRLWLDPEKLAARDLTAGDVIRALREQNVQVAAGQIGQPPVPRGIDFQYTMNAAGRLTTPEEFAGIIIKTGSQGQLTRVGGIGRVELGARSQDQMCTLGGKPTAGLGVFQVPGSNAVATAHRVRAEMETLKSRQFPEGLDYAIVYDTTLGFRATPTGFVPDQDKGYLLVCAQLPDSASFERTCEVTRRMDEISRAMPGVKHALSIAGQSFLMNANGSNFASMFVILDPFDHRESEELHAAAIAARLRKQLFVEIEGAAIAVFGAPPVDGLGNAGGFMLMVEDRGDRGLETLEAEVDRLVDQGNRASGLVGLMAMFRANAPQLFADIDRANCKAMGVALDDVFEALQVFLGGYYVNDFNEFGRTWQVNLQADARFRLHPEDVKRLKVRNAEGQMAPLGAVVQVRDATGPQLITRYNTYPAAAVNGNWAPNMSSGEAIATVQALAEKNLSPGMAFEWTGLTFQQIAAGNTALFIFPLCVLFVFLTHSAEYESWTLPLAIILIVPMSILCALAGVWWRGMDNNLFTQIGFVVLAGLACKNAVLIVEFAKQQQEQGLSSHGAALKASRLRLRPIMMTAMAFILGVVPLMLSSGAGAEMRRALGTAVFSGMLGVTFFGIFLTPVFYCLLQRRHKAKQVSKS